VLRRSQWNVCTSVLVSPTFTRLPIKELTLWSRADRLENEHLGNMDQYRITREVPLPYSFDEIQPETDVGDEDDEPQTSVVHGSAPERLSRSAK
jgi:hypothetical protein